MGKIRSNKDWREHRKKCHKDDCSGKAAFNSKKAAKDCLARQGSKMRTYKGYHVYQCPDCYKWHIGRRR